MKILQLREEERGGQPSWRNKGIYEETGWALQELQEHLLDSLFLKKGQQQLLWCGGDLFSPAAGEGLD